MNSPQWHHLNLAASWRNAGTSLLSFWDNIDLESTTRIHVLTHMNSHLMLENPPFAIYLTSKVRKNGEYSGYCGNCQWIVKLIVYRAGD